MRFVFICGLPGTSPLLIETLALSSVLAIIAFLRSSFMIAFVLTCISYEASVVREACNGDSKNSVAKPAFLVICSNNRVIRYIVDFMKNLRAHGAAHGLISSQATDKDPTGDARRVQRSSRHHRAHATCPKVHWSGGILN